MSKNRQWPAAGRQVKGKGNQWKAKPTYNKEVVENRQANRQTRTGN